jgi:L-gulonolactone oxidase
LLAREGIRVSTAVYRNRSFAPWGRIGAQVHPVAAPRYRDEVAAALEAREGQSVLAVGLGRSYGDSVLNPGGCLIDMTGLDRVIVFDREAGVLRAEAGLSIDAALRFLVPAGWFLPTTPGTRFVTLGGAVANDVHGKNHHSAGSLGCSVRRFGLRRSDGNETECSSDDELFRATIGGVGLTGIITWVEIGLARIPSAYLDLERAPFEDVGGFFGLAKASSATHEHTVAWFDCARGGEKIGRGIFQRANWAPDGGLEPHPERQLVVVPVDAPSWALNGLTVRAFNSLYWRLQKAGAQRVRAHYASVFYPLDALGQWNRLYGGRGFYQYQCVVPHAGAEAAVLAMLQQIARAGAGSFLAVLKTFGPRVSPGLLSFPREGVTLALDFPNRGQATLDLLAGLDAIVLDAGGRLYPAKDGRMSAKMFQAGYGAALSRFSAQIDPAFSSQFWRRVSS